MHLLIKNIDHLVGVREQPVLLKGEALNVLPIIENAYVIVEGDEIAGYGPMKDLPYHKVTEVIDATGQWVMPCWCDSHTHLVYAASREAEMVEKIKGASYSEIAAKGGGILNSAKKINETDEDTLFKAAWKRLEHIKNLGTGAVEIKSGYGLSVEGELKMLRVVKRLKEQSDLIIKSTFLGAHAYPEAFKNDHQGYIRLVVEEMLPVIAAENLADFMDVFCEEGFFSAEETEQVLEAGKRFGLKPKIHANQLHRSGGVQVGVRQGAVSVDHLETIGEEEIACLEGAETIATALPTAAFFLRLPYPPVREMINRNIAVALATDYNPGSAPSGNMPLLVSFSCIQMAMTPEEALNAATLNGAYAMEVQGQAGSITIGKKANLIFTKPMPSLAYLPYSFGENLISRVMIKGTLQE